jgi:hypothetical protein
LIGTGDGAKSHLLPRVDEALILQRLPPRTTSAAGPPIYRRHRVHAGVGVNQLLLNHLLLIFVLVGLFFILVDGGFIGVAMVYEADEDLGATGNLHNK